MRIKGTRLFLCLDRCLDFSKFALDQCFPTFLPSCTKITSCIECAYHEFTLIKFGCKTVKH